MKTPASVRAATVSVAALLLAACAVGPNYQRPDAPLSAAFKEAAKPPKGWKVGAPNDTAMPAAWWTVYNDPVLDALEAQVAVNNQNVRAYQAAYAQARAVVQEARSSLFPTLSGSGSGTRSGSGGGNKVVSGSSTGSGTVVGVGNSGTASNDFSLSGSGSWTPDIWGATRRTVEGDIASAQASAAELAYTQLTAQSTLASNYLQLRVADELKALYDQTAASYQAALTITQNQSAAGIAGPPDVASAEAQLRIAQAQAISVGVTRAQLEHSIAVLIGKPPAEVSIKPVSRRVKIPAIPATGVPSTLLERRPDVAQAERQMAAANAQIGVAIANFFPDLTLNGSYGFDSSSLSKLLQASSSVWSFAGTLAGTLLDAGGRTAQVDAARASYDQTVANYRQTVLTAIQGVEDQLATLRIRARQAAVQDQAVAAARQAEALTLNQYKAGTVAYSSVITAQQTALSAAVTAVNIRQDRLTASVSLIEALGGGWSTAELPNSKSLDTNAPPFPGMGGSKPDTAPAPTTLSKAAK